MNALATSVDILNNLFRSLDEINQKLPDCNAAFEQAKKDLAEVNKIYDEKGIVVSN